MNIRINKLIFLISALINDVPSGFQRGDVDASAPMPNIGGWRGGAELRYRGPFLALTTNW